MDEFKITHSSETFRVKKMNAIEALALQSQIDFDSVESTEKLYNAILERLEVKVNDQWLPVKEKGRNIYYPDGIENCVNVIQELIHHFLYDYLKPLFQKSNA